MTSSQSFWSAKMVSGSSPVKKSSGQCLLSLWHCRQHLCNIVKRWHIPIPSDYTAFTMLDSRVAFRICGCDVFCQAMRIFQTVNNCSTCHLHPVEHCTMSNWTCIWDPRTEHDDPLESRWRPSVKFIVPLSYTLQRVFSIKLKKECTTYEGTTSSYGQKGKLHQQSSSWCFGPKTTAFQRIC